MNKEIPIANPPLTAEEQSLVANLSGADLEIIDSTILANSSEQWLKVAMVVSKTKNALEARYPGITYVFYTQRISELANNGCLESQGYIFYMRFSEVRLPIKRSSSN